MTGKDGKIYNARYDYNSDGKLDTNERIMYEANMESSGEGDWGKGRNPFTLMRTSSNIFINLIAAFIWIIGFGVLCIFPPLGALIILGAISLSESY